MPISNCCGSRDSSTNNLRCAVCTPSPSRRCASSARRAASCANCPKGAIWYRRSRSRTTGTSPKRSVSRLRNSTVTCGKPQQALPGNEFLRLGLQSVQPRQGQLVEPLQTQDRRETGRLRSGAHPEIGREPQSLHGVARILLVARPLPRRHDLPAQTGHYHLPHRAGPSLAVRKDQLRIQRQVHREDHPARYGFHAHPPRRDFQQRDARRRTRTHHPLPARSGILQLLGQQHLLPLPLRHGRQPRRRPDDGRQTIPHGLQRPRRTRHGEQQGLPDQRNQHAARIRSHGQLHRSGGSLRYGGLPRPERRLRREAQRPPPCAAPGDSALSQLPLQRGADQPHLQQHHVAGLLQEHAHHLRRTAGARQHEPRLLHRQRRRLAGHAIYAGRLSALQHSRHAAAQTELQDRPGRDDHFEFLRIEGLGRLSEPEPVPGDGIVRHRIQHRPRVHEIARQRQAQRQGVRRHGGAGFPAFPAALLFEPLPAVARDAAHAARTVVQLSGSTLLPPHADQHDMDLLMEQREILVVRRTARRPESGRP